MKTYTAPKIIALVLGIMFVLFSAIGLMANLIHRSTIKDYEQLGKVYSGPVTDNYFFESPDLGNKSGTRISHMICFKPENPPKNTELMCSSEYVSESFAEKYPIGSKMSAYYRSDISDLLLIPAIENWKNDWLMQYMPLVFFILGLLLIGFAKISRKSQ